MLVLPNFLICGVQKGGTTALHRALGQHPLIGMSKPKELHYFDRDENYQKGLEWYSRFFLPFKNFPLRGEATPESYCSPNASRKILTDLPDVKCLFILQNPVAQNCAQLWRLL